MRAIVAVDPMLDDLVARHGPPRLGGPVAVRDRFASLARAIAFQQLSGRAASTIWRRVEQLLDGEVHPDRILALDPLSLRECGLSTAKVASVVDLARAVSTGDLGLESIGRLDDEAVVQQLVRVRGIGRWTAEMFLMSALRRRDVWPVGDLGVRVGFGRLFLDGRVPASAELEGAADRFRPWRSSLAWYCWRAVEDPSLDHPGGVTTRS